ncbi:SDR family oxidoreductase [uncultured Paracoccus sp.]|uniref:SDR family NAD(P)-dependent oxidoreductase n=1 Tax=uncultured Paracoccus sp. TaxID=189685 RepID=UPI002598E856|nr:SDR family oxidoreductase [uncultured Paracoccus sp.]
MGYQEVFGTSFAGKTVLLSGGTGGIGLALAKGFADCGATVIATGGSEKRLAGAQAQARPNLSFERLDVRDHDAVRARFEKLGELDVLVNCQGVARPGDEWDEETFLAVMDINLNSAMRLARAAYPGLKARRGNIINVASMLSYLADPTVPSYTASKTGIVGLTRALAHQWGADGIRVNAIAPGYHKTEMTKPLWSESEAADRIAQRAAAKRWGTVEDLVGPTLFLASDAAGFVTGAVLPVDGGYHTG